MGPIEIPSQSTETIKIPTATYEFGANYIDPKVPDLLNVRCFVVILNYNVMALATDMQLMLFGRILTDGRLNARVKCDLSDNLTLKGNAQVIWFLLSCSYRVLSYFIFLQFHLLISYIYIFFQLTNEPHMSHGMVNFDYKVIKCGKIYNLAQFYYIML